MGLIKDDYPDVIKYLVNKNDASIYTHGTVGKVLCKCPLCKHEKLVEIHNLCINGFHCDVYSDGISLPNKWIRNVLFYNHINFISEYHPPYFPKRWTVDVFIPSENIIIEMDGDYGNHNSERDGYRDKLSIENANSKIIRFDLSDGKYRTDKNILVNMTIKLLGDILDIKNTNWNYVWELSQKSLVKEVCDYYEKHKCSTLGLALFFQLNVCTIIKYLKLGNDLGFCNYNVEDQKRKNSKSIQVYDIKDNSIKVFKSSSDLERQSMDIYGIKFTHVREIRRSFDEGKRSSLYLNRFRIESYNSCND